MFKQTETPQEDKEEDSVANNSPRPSGAAPSIIGVDVKLSGNLITVGEVQFDGHIEGDLHCGSLTIGESATIEGSVVAETVIVHGTLSGTIRAQTVRLERTSKVLGDVLHEDLAIASGAHIEGRCERVTNALEDRIGVAGKASNNGTTKSFETVPQAAQEPEKVAS